MEFNSEKLITELQYMVTAASASTKEFRKLDMGRLNYREDEESWSILQCIEHLNLYGDFYLPEIEQRIISSNHPHFSETFHSGMIGNYFANLMLAKNGRIKKMKSPKNKRPSESRLSLITIDRFIKQLDKLHILLERSRNIDLTKTKTSISISKFITLRLGDTFRFLIYHIDRHIQQAKRAERNASKMLTSVGVMG